MEKLVKWSDKAAMILLCVLMADCAVFGAGRTIAIGSVGFRMLVVGLLLAVSLPVMIRKVPVIIKDKFFWMLVAFMCWLIFQMIVGVKNGHSSSLIASDIKGFAYLVVFLPALCVLTSRERIHTLMKVMMYSTVVLSAAAIFFLFSNRWFPAVFNAFYSFDSNFYISGFSNVGPGVIRLFFKSSNYLLCGCAFPLYFAVKSENKKTNWQYAGIIGLSLLVLLMSYTRSIYLAIFAAALLLVIVVVKFGMLMQRKKLWKHIGAAVMVFSILLVTLSVLMGTNFLGYALERVGLSFVQLDLPDTLETMEATMPMETTTPTEVTESPTDPNEVTLPNDEYRKQTIRSDQIRQETLQELWELIYASPIVGHGLGKALTVRYDGINEYFYLDLVVKTGIIGLLLYLMPIIVMCFALFRKSFANKEAFMLAGTWLAVLLGFAVFSYFNPYMNASLGVLFYCCTMAVFRFVSAE